MELYQDRICFLAGEENALGRFLKDHGKSDKTRAGKMMVAAGKTMSYTGQQRLAIRVPLVRLYQEVDTFRLRAIEDTRWTVEAMEKARTEYRGALMWMKNVSTELDPDTFKQLEKFRKVQAHVKTSKQKFDKLKLDCVQKIDLLAASRCNMFSHALIMYQNTLVTFWDKTSKTMNHVNNGFKGYQYYEFNYIKDLAAPAKQLVAPDDKKEANEIKSTAASFPDSQELVNLSTATDNDDAKEKEMNKSDKKTDSLHNLLDLDMEPSEPVPLLDDDDEVLLNIDSELSNSDANKMFEVENIFQHKNISDVHGATGAGIDDGQWPVHDNQQSEKMLDELLASTNNMEIDNSGGFTAEWENAFRKESLLPTDEFADLMSENNSISSKEDKSKGNQSFLPSQLFEFNNFSQHSNTKSGLIPTNTSGIAQTSKTSGKEKYSFTFSVAKATLEIALFISYFICQLVSKTLSSIINH